ncbi:Uncharacterised protein [Edwardsiella tarda]|nr:Uncharacterised protein [Edwardsiella tarda]
MKVTVKNEAHHTVDIVGLSVEAREDLANAIMAGLVVAARRGVKRFSRACTIVLVLIIFIPWLAFKMGWTVDSTDGTSPSGLKPYTDALTGCQYLSAGGNGITPRMDVNGHQICVKESGK